MDIRLLAEENCDEKENYPYYLAGGIIIQKDMTKLYPMFKCFSATYKRNKQGL